MHTLRTSGVRTALIMPGLRMPSRALTPAVAHISMNGTQHSHLVQPIRNRINWLRMGEVCLRSSAAATDVQGARVAGFGGYDVTDTKFSIRLGPPSCSPPV